MFFFPSFFFFPPLALSLFVKSCRQCTFTLAYTAHKSPKPDVLLNILIKPISWVEHMAQLQCKPAQGTLLKKKTLMILSSTQSTLQWVPLSNTHTGLVQSRPVQSQMCPMLPEERETDQIEQIQSGEKKNVFHILPLLLQNTSYPWFTRGPLSHNTMSPLWMNRIISRLLQD